MAKVLVRGPLLTQSGYGVHSRQIFKWLMDAGHDITVQATPRGITPWYISRLFQYYRSNTKVVWYYNKVGN